MRRSLSDSIERLLEEEPVEALALLDAEIDSGDEDPDLLAYRAEALEAAGEVTEALVAWSTYLEADPEWPGAYCRRAELLGDLGRFDAARAELNMASELFDEDARLTRCLALVEELQGNFGAADRAYTKAEDADFATPAPPRFDRDEVRAALERQLGDEGEIQVEEVPQSAGDWGHCRPFDVTDDGGLIVYLRNLERELEPEATITDLLDLLAIARSD